MTGFAVTALVAVSMTYSSPLWRLVMYACVLSSLNATSAGWPPTSKEVIPVFVTVLMTYTRSGELTYKSCPFGLSSTLPTDQLTGNFRDDIPCRSVDYRHVRRIVPAVGVS